MAHGKPRIFKYSFLTGNELYSIHHTETRLRGLRLVVSITTTDNLMLNPRHLRPVPMVAHLSPVRARLISPAIIHLTAGPLIPAQHPEISALAMAATSIPVQPPLSRLHVRMLHIPTALCLAQDQPVVAARFPVLQGFKTQDPLKPASPTNPIRHRARLHITLTSPSLGCRQLAQLTLRDHTDQYVPRPCKVL